MKKSKPIFIDNKSKIGILMLHGFTSAPENLKDAAFFASENGFNVSVPVLAGHGTCPEDLSKTSAKDWKKSAKDAYLELKNISEDVFIMGISFGGNLAFWLAKEFEGGVRGIISLSSPIFLRHHSFIILRLYSYGFFKKYYKKPVRTFKIDKSGENEIIYSKIPTKSLREFFRFIKKETIPNLHKVKVPLCVLHSKHDNIVHPKSAYYIFKKAGSSFKEIGWLENRHHAIEKTEILKEIFEKINSFIKRIKDV